MKNSLFFILILFRISSFAQDGDSFELSNELYLFESQQNSFDYAEEVDDKWMLNIYNSPLFDTNLTAKNNDELTTNILKERLAILNHKTPFLVEHNATLERFIRLYLKTRRDDFANLMDKAQYYFPIFEEQLDKYDLPLEIKYLAIVESALEPNARSVVGAKGLWQFMYHTGKQFGLEVNSYVDERADPLKATEAACKYLLSLYNTFYDWDLALAAYNSGPGNVSKAIRRSGGLRNYWNIRKYLPLETRSYVPAFYATFYMFEFGSEHNIYPKNTKMTFFDTDTIRVKKKLTFSKINKEIGIDHKILKDLNPQYKLGIIPFNDKKAQVLILPKSFMSKFVINERRIYDLPAQSNPQREMAHTIAANDENCYVVQHGDHLPGIAKKFEITLEKLKQWNGLETNYLIKGQCLVVQLNNQLPLNDRLPAEQLSSNEAFIRNRTELAEKTFTTYIVKEGESLFMISKRYSDVSINQIRNWNNIWGLSFLKPGTKLKILTNSE